MFSGTISLTVISIIIFCPKKKGVLAHTIDYFWQLLSFLMGLEILCAITDLGFDQNIITKIINSLL